MQAGMKLLPHFALFLAAVVSLRAANLPSPRRQFLDSHCTECHDADTRKGGLDLTSLKFDLEQTTNFAKWVLVHNRVSNAEMPPSKKPRPDTAELAVFLKSLSSSLVSSEQKRLAAEGRSTQRRLNRYEYENALRDLLHAPWLQVRDSLPEDGESLRFNKVGDALDVSHVQMARYLSTADDALRDVMATQVDRPQPQT